MGLTTRVVDLHLRRVGLAAGMVGRNLEVGPATRMVGVRTPLKSGSDNQGGGSTLEKSWFGS